MIGDRPECCKLPSNKTYANSGPRQHQDSTDKCELDNSTAYRGPCYRQNIPRLGMYKSWNFTTENRRRVQARRPAAHPQSLMSILLAASCVFLVSAGAATCLSTSVASGRWKSGQAISAVTETRPWASNLLLVHSLIYAATTNAPRFDVRKGS
jgi:hypothetical protein